MFFFFAGSFLHVQEAVLSMLKMAYIKNPIQAISYNKFRPSPPKELIYKIVNFLKEEVGQP